MPLDDFGSRSLSLHAPHRHLPARVLARMLDRVGPDDLPGDLIETFERRVADLLGKPAAALFPTGTMAQQVALRIHADRRGIRTVAFHPQCHLEVHEHKGYSAVHGLVARLVGGANELVTLADLTAVGEPVAALLLELPQRDLGGRMPSWDDLVAQVGWARDVGAAAHLDGARLWEAQPYYDRPHADIAALFDSVYVSLYKGLTGFTGAVLAGEEPFVEHARVWRNRLGGSTARSWPVVLAAQRGLDDLLPRMPEFLARARSVATLLARIPGVQVVPDPPQTPLFHVHLAAPPDAVRQAMADLLTETGMYTALYVRPQPSPRSCAFEITVGEQFDDLTDTEVAEHVATLAKRAGAG